VSACLVDLLARLSHVKVRLGKNGGTEVGMIDGIPDPEAALSQRRKWRCERGAVFVEFLIVFLPVLTFFLCLLQLALLFTVRLATEHAALTAARAAAVIIGDEKKRYGNEPPNQLKVGGKREQAIKNAVYLTLAGFILDGTIEKVTVVFPAADKAGGPGQKGTITYRPMGFNRPNDPDKDGSFGEVAKVRVRVEVEASCKIGLANRIMCSKGLGNIVRGALGLQPTTMVKAEAVFPYQGAYYAYK
jgi:hypothetical protein